MPISLVGFVSLGLMGVGLGMGRMLPIIFDWEEDGKSAGELDVP